MIVDYNIGLKPLLQQYISEPVFYGNLVYKSNRIVRKRSFPDHITLKGSSSIIQEWDKHGYYATVSMLGIHNHGLYL